jgi:hydroxymethylbilane synthase
MGLHGLGEDAFEIRTIRTMGDVITGRPLADVGGKGLFTKEIEEALLSGTIDIAVHSMKDMPTALPGGLAIGAVLAREDPRDAFISLKYARLEDLPQGAVVGTSSLRRQAQVKRLRPDLEVAPFRGNVETRLRKLAEGTADATLLACAGLNRLGLAGRITSLMELDTMLPAVAQGAIAVEVRADDKPTSAVIASLNDEATALCVTAERAFLARLEGSCRTPIAGHAVLEAGEIAFRGMTLSPDGAQCFAASRRGPASDPARIGAAAADEILARGARLLLAGNT